MEKALILLEDGPNPFCVVVDPGRSEVSISSPSGGSFIRHFTARVVATPPSRHRSISPPFANAVPMCATARKSTSVFENVDSSMVPHFAA